MKCEECNLSDIPEEIRKDTIKCNVCKLNSAFRTLFDEIYGSLIKILNRKGL